MVVCVLVAFDRPQNLNRVSKRVMMTDYGIPCFVILKHLQLDIFVTDIGLYSSCFCAGIKSAHTFYKICVSKILCAPVSNLFQARSSETINPFTVSISDLQPANQKSAIMRSAYRYLVLKMKHMIVI